MSTGERLCPHCGAGETIGAAEKIWPDSWRCGSCNHRVESRDGIPMFAPALADTEVGMNPLGFEPLAGREAGHFWFEPRNRLLTSLIGRYFPASRDFLEVGCGTGFVLSAVAKSKSWSRIVGSELHPAGLAYARKRADSSAEFVQMDATQIPARNAFDVVGAFDVLEHIPDDEKALAEIFSALRPGGGAVLAVPQHPFLWSREDEIALHQRRYRRNELQEKVRRAGFEILFSNSYTSFLLPLMAASRLMSRNRAPISSEESNPEFNLPPALNAILRGALQAEVTLSLLGLPLPAGGSRIVVARKPR